MDPSPLARPLNCHANVADHVSIYGGEAVRGWYHSSYRDGLDYQAILHTVWKDQNGTLIDITPFDEAIENHCFSAGAIQLPAPLCNAYLRSLDKYMGYFEEPMYYVYALIDPRTSLPFYIGKGTGKRANTHLWNMARSPNPYKENVIRAIREIGLEPQILYLAEDILDERIAYDMEETIIRTLGRKGYEENGILTNSCLGSRPPSHKGRTYEEIYGPERAKEQREKRRALQVAAGGYGPKSHSEETRRKIGVKSSSRTGWHHRDETKKKIADILSQRRGELNSRARRYVLKDPAGIEYTIFGWNQVKDFCRKHNLSFGTFHKKLLHGWPDARRGKNVGWTIRDDGPKDNSITHEENP